jgi:hypothetical protein
MTLFVWLIVAPGLVALGFFAATVMFRNGAAQGGAVRLGPAGRSVPAPVNQATRDLLAALASYRSAFERSMAFGGAGEADARAVSAEVLVHRWGLGRILARLVEEAERGVADPYREGGRGVRAVEGPDGTIVSCRFEYEGLAFTLTTIGSEGGTPNAADRSLALSVEDVEVLSLAGMRRTLDDRYDWTSAEVRGFEPGEWIGALCSLDCRMSVGQRH